MRVEQEDFKVIQDDWKILTSEEGMALVEAHLDEYPERLALSLRNPTVTRQVRMLQRCREKLPSFYAARCVVPQVSYEQSSSEATARVRVSQLCDELPPEARRLAVDLTCGLGVDAWALSRGFERVVAVEIDAERAEMARWNMQRLGAENVEVVCRSAEEFVAGYGDGRPIDVVYVDPSRKREDGRRVYSLEESTPNMVELMPALQRVARRVVVKLSPLFDVAEVRRVFGEEVRVEVVSLEGECKEVVAAVGFGKGVRVTVIRRGEVRHFDFEWNAVGSNAQPKGNIDAESTEAWPYVLAPDVAFVKGRVVEAYVEQVLVREVSGLRWTMCGEYVLASAIPTGFAGTAYRILSVHPYQPKVLKRQLREQGVRRINLHRHGFPYSAEQIARSLGVALGGATEVVCAVVGGAPMVMVVERLWNTTGSI